MVFLRRDCKPFNYAKIKQSPSPIQILLFKMTALLKK